MARELNHGSVLVDNIADKVEVQIPYTDVVRDTINLLVEDMRHWAAFKASPHASAVFSHLLDDYLKDKNLG